MVARLAGFLAALVVCGISVAGPANAVDAAAGEKVFKSQCSICHSPEAGKNRIGPTVFGVVGRHSGTVEGFKYSAANKGADITWSPEILDKYLANPKAIVPGTIMTYAGLKNEEQRHDLIAYLETLH